MFIFASGERILGERQFASFGLFVNGKINNSLNSVYEDKF